MFRRFANRPNPLSNCCCSVTIRFDCTAGLKKFTAELEEDRVLFHRTVAVVRVENHSVTLFWYTVACVVRFVSILVWLVSELNGWYTGVLRSSNEICDVSVGSKFINGMLAKDCRTSAPLIPNGCAPASVAKISVSANHTL